MEQDNSQEKHEYLNLSQVKTTTRQIINVAFNETQKISSATYPNDYTREARMAESASGQSKVWISAIEELKDFRVQVDPKDVESLEFIDQAINAAEIKRDQQLELLLEYRTYLRSRKEKKLVADEDYSVNTSIDIRKGYDSGEALTVLIIPNLGSIHVARSATSHTSLRFLYSDGNPVIRARFQKVDGKPKLLWLDSLGERRTSIFRNLIMKSLDLT